MTADAALGFCATGVRLPEDLALLSCGPVSVVVLRGGATQTPHQRLATCVRTIEFLDGFLPLPPRHAVSPDRAHAHLVEHGAAISRQLQLVQSRFEAIFAFVTDAGAVPEKAFTGRDWLAARRMAMNQRRVAEDEAQQLVACMTLGLDPTHARTTAAPGRIHVSVLLPRAALPDLRDRVEQFDTIAGLPGTTLTVTAPWPVFSFAASQAEEGARCPIPA